MKFEESHKIAQDFANKVYEKFREVVKSIILFGSAAREDIEEGSDIDIIIIVDDATVKWDQELTAWYREELAKLVSSVKYPKKLHVNTVTLTTFWNQVLIGEPVVINVIRYGLPLIDFGGFFNPLKILLARGRIKPTDESIYNALNRAPIHLAKAKFNVLSAIDSLYWSMVDAAHAALMAHGNIPPSPEQIDVMLKEHFVRKGKLKQKYVDWYREIYKLAHKIAHGEVSDFKGKEIELYRDRADRFVGEMARLVKINK